MNPSVQAMVPPSCPPPDGGGEGCRLRTPVTLLGSMVSVLRSYFGSRDRAVMDKAAFLYDPVPGSSGLRIDDEFNWNFADSGSIPALVVSLEDFAIGAGSDTIGRKGLSGFDAPTGASSVSSFEAGAFSIQCLCKTKLESWSLAWEAKTLLQSYAYEIGRAYRFGNFAVKGVKKPTSLEGPYEAMAAVVGVTFTMTNSWSVEKEGLPATRYTLDVGMG